jgi:hypothetical protein
MADTPFSAYSEDCLVRATLDLPAGVRLTDHLNDSDVVQLRGAQLKALDDGRVVDVGDLELDRTDLCAVEAPSSTAFEQFRIRTRASRIQMELGPYLVVGLLHSPTAGDPLLGLNRRKTMIPMTDVSVTFTLAGRQRTVHVDVLIINQNKALSAQHVQYQHSKIDDMGLSPVDERARDLTGAISQGIRD